MSGSADTFAHMIEVPLTLDEVHARLHKLVNVDREIDAIAAEKAGAMADFGKQLKDKRAERKSLLEVIESKKHKVEVQCFHEKDERRGMMLTLRADTNELVDERALTVEELNADRQGKLFEEKKEAAPPIDGEEPEEPQTDADLEAALEDYQANGGTSNDSEDDEDDADESDSDDEDEDEGDEAKAADSD